MKLFLFLFLFLTLTNFIAKSWALPNCNSDYRHNCSDYVSYKDGSTYKGEFKNNRPHGEGTYLWPNRTKYVGKFRNGKRNIFGYVTFPDGASYIGEFKDDKFDGLGTYTFSNGKVSEGIWKENKFLYAKEKPKFSDKELSGMIDEIFKEKKSKESKANKNNYKIGDTEVKDSVCAVKPFDNRPENRINVMASKGIVTIMHVKDDFKTFISKPIILKIELIKQINNMTTHRLEDNSIVAIDFKTGLSIYYKPPIEKGGIQYKCKKVNWVRD